MNLKQTAVKPFTSPSQGPFFEGDNHVQASQVPHTVRSERRTIEPGAAWRGVVYRLGRLVYLAASALDLALGLRVVLRLIGANPSNFFAAALYRATDLVLWPFASLVANPTINRHILEVTTLIAMAVYALAGWLLVQLIWTVFYKARGQEVTITEQQRR